ncbi:MAG TPA: tail fiber domain-containing protein [Terriglobales bacterium]|nr:tail fiber domain-containing protein [Terriglobales bacterium]
MPITFSLYVNANGGEALWKETQTVFLDSMGRYSVYLGLTQTNGIPVSLFTTGEAHWLGVKIAAQPEKPRIFLVSVPYAMKAGDAATVGGLPPSAFVLAAPASGSVTVSSNRNAVSAVVGTTPVTTAGGTQNQLAKFDAAADITNSIIFDNGTSVGIGTTSPASTLDIKGGSTVRGTLSLPAAGTATSAVAAKSQGLNLAASTYNTSLAKAVDQTFRWQVVPTANDSVSPSATLSLLFGANGAAPSSTVLKVGSNGQITFAPGQTFPGTGKGTITGVTAGTDLIGGGTSGSVTLSLDTSKIPQLTAANTFTGNQTVSGNLSATGIVTGNSFNIGSHLFAYGAYANQNVFLGFSGNTASTGTNNTASGYQALAANTTGQQNTADGQGALFANTTGIQNTAVGQGALRSNTTGGGNVAVGISTLPSNTTGSNNIGIGAGLVSNTSGSDNIAIGLSSTFSNTTGSFNTAVGEYTIGGVSGNYNTAAGYLALYSNPCSASYNTAVGYGAGYTAVSIATCGQGNNNTFVGANTMQTDLRFNNATAIGANAQVAASNALVLGSINGVNRATADTLVGIGITAPTYKLHVGSINKGLRVEGPPAGTLNPVAVSLGGYGDFGIDAPGVPEGRFVVKDTSGFVGIGTATPDALLSVNGGADKPGGGSWGTFSDRRLKTLDGEFTLGVDEIVKLNPVRYRYKLDNGMGIQDNEEHVGLVAQEVQEIVPEAVTKNNQGYLLVNNDPIIWAMLNAIKQQQKQIAAQERQIRRQQELINAQLHQATQLSHKVEMLESSVRALQGKTPSLIADEEETDWAKPPLRH